MFCEWLYLLTACDYKNKTAKNIEILVFVFPSISLHFVIKYTRFPSFGHRSSYWDYFDKTIKFTPFFECVVVILRVLLTCKSKTRFTSYEWLLNLSFIRSNLEVPKFPLQHGFEKSLCGHYITIIFLQLGNLEVLIQIRLNSRVLQ